MDALKPRYRTTGRQSHCISAADISFEQFAGSRTNGHKGQDVPIGILELKSISIAAQLGSLSRTADALNITQPALSRRIKEAERALGIKLFIRLPRGMKATEACLAFLRHAEVALTSISDGYEAALDVEHRRAQSVPVGLLEVFCDTMLMDACSATRDAIPGTAIDFTTSITSTDVSADLLSGATKLGLRYRRDTSPQLEAVWLADDPVVAACAPSHRLAVAGRATIEQLEHVQLLGYPTAMDRTTTAYLEGGSQTGFQNWKTMNVPTIYSRLRLIEAGVGIALVRRACIVDQLQAGTIVELETPLNCSIPVFLAWRRGSYLGDAGEYLRERLLKNYRAASPAGG